MIDHADHNERRNDRWRKQSGRVEQKQSEWSVGYRAELENNREYEPRSHPQQQKQKDKRKEPPAGPELVLSVEQQIRKHLKILLQQQVELRFRCFGRRSQICHDRVLQCTPAFAGTIDGKALHRFANDLLGIGGPEDAGLSGQFSGYPCSVSYSGFCLPHAHPPGLSFGG